MTTTFELQMRRQHWLGEPHEQFHDGCSHGGIRAGIAGTEVTSESDEYGISQSALSLLRTLEQDHTPANPVSGGYLLSHGCGYPIAFGCSNFGTDWVVHHEGDTVVLRQPTHYASIRAGRDDPHETEFDVRARLPIEQYRRQIVAFAQEARDFLMTSEPRRLEAWEHGFHDQFWAEFEERLERAKAQGTERRA